MTAKTRILRVSIVAIMVVVGGLLLDAAPTTEASAPSAERGRASIAETFTVIGDSITSGCSNVMTYPVDPCSWAAAVDARADWQYVGGWAHRGATSAVDLANAGPQQARILVILNGTNDFKRISVEQQIQNDRAIAAIVGAPRVMELALPPSDNLGPGDRAPFLARNAALQAAAVQAGWWWFDPWAQWRSGDGSAWTSRTDTQDGTHPTPAVWAEAGAAIADQLAFVRL